MKEDHQGGPISSGRKGSVLAERFARGQLGTEKAPKRFPTNEDVVKALQEKVEQTVDLCENYRHAVWYMVFVAVYMIVLYFQVTSFQASSVVSTLRGALLDDPTTSSLVFSSEDQVLAYLGNHVVRPVWTDPICGDGTCEAPWEFPAWGPFGCRPDCGQQPNLTSVIVTVTGDFVGHPSLSPRLLMERVSWNLCLDDEARRKRGETDLCWFETDQTFSQYQETQIQSMSLVDGSWYVRIVGDFAGRVSGAVYNMQNESDPSQLPVQPVWDSCKQRRSTVGTGAAASMRRLQEAYGKLKSAVGPEEARSLMERALVEASKLSAAAGGGGGSSDTSS